MLAGLFLRFVMPNSRKDLVGTYMPPALVAELIDGQVVPVRAHDVMGRGKTLAIRSQCLGTCSKVFQAVDAAIPPTIREVT